MTYISLAAGPGIIFTTSLLATFRPTGPFLGPPSLFLGPALQNKSVFVNISMGPVYVTLGLYDKLIT
jgi:hypothetical protein